MNELLNSLWTKHGLLLDRLVSIDVSHNISQFTKIYYQAVENILTIVEFARYEKDYDTIWRASCEMCKINYANHVDIESAIWHQLISKNRPFQGQTKMFCYCRPIILGCHLYYLQ